MTAWSTGQTVAPTTETGDNRPSPAPASGLEEEETQGETVTWDKHAWLIACGILTLIVLLAEIYYRCKRCRAPGGRPQLTHMQITSQL